MTRLGTESGAADFSGSVMFENQNGLQNQFRSGKSIMRIIDFQILVKTDESIMQIIDLQIIVKTDQQSPPAKTEQNRIE